MSGKHPGRLEQATDTLIPSVKNLALIQSPQQLLNLHYRVLNYQKKSLAQIPFTGFSSDYFVRKTQRSRAGRAGTNTLLWSSIDADIPTELTHSKCCSNGVREAVIAAFQGNANGIILSRKDSEMKHRPPGIAHRPPRTPSRHLAAIAIRCSLPFLR